nr:hypothetical protein [Tanacetum cinerariifolium]
PNFACCGGFVESGLQERYALTETEEGVAGNGVHALGRKIGEQCTVFLNVGGQGREELIDEFRYKIVPS